MDPLSALVAADGPSSRPLLSLLESVPAVVVAGTCDTAGGVARALRAHTSPLLIVDAAFPPDGAQAVLARLERDVPPAVVITSAEPGDGLWAYALGAVDCLPAPVTLDRLRTAVDRAQERIVGAEIRAHRDQLLTLLTGDAAPPPPIEPGPRTLVVRSGSQLIFLDPDEVDWIEASGVYVSVHVGPTTHLIRETLRHVEEQLDPARFVRVHRSTILNLARVRKIVPHLNGGAIVLLKDGTRLKMSRSYRERIHACLG